MKTKFLVLAVLLLLGGCSNMKWNADPEKVEELGCYQNTTGDPICPGHL
jgi:hypothetical protein